MLFFEFFPALIALVVMIVGVFLFAMNWRAGNDPNHQEPPRTPSQPAVPADAEQPPAATVRRPSMRA